MSERSLDGVLTRCWVQSGLAEPRLEKTVAEQQTHSEPVTEEERIRREAAYAAVRRFWYRMNPKDAMDCVALHIFQEACDRLNELPVEIDRQTIGAEVIDNMLHVGFTNTGRAPYKNFIATVHREGTCLETGKGTKLASWDESQATFKPEAPVALTTVQAVLDGLLKDFEAMVSRYSRQ